MQGKMLLYWLQHMVVVAQLVRAPGCGPGGHRFKSGLPPHFEFSAPVRPLAWSFFLFYANSVLTQKFARFIPDVFPLREFSDPGNFLKFGGEVPGNSLFRIWNRMQYHPSDLTRTSLKLLSDFTQTSITFPHGASPCASGTSHNTGYEGFFSGKRVCKSVRPIKTRGWR